MTGTSNGPLPVSSQDTDLESRESILDALEHFRSIATMLELIDRLPDLAEDIRTWRPLDPSEVCSHLAAPLHPVSRHALSAVLNGLNMLGLAAATLCDNAEGRLTADETAACRDIGGAMNSLFERARALLHPREPPDRAAERAELYRSFLRAPSGPPRQSATAERRS